MKQRSHEPSFEDRWMEAVNKVSEAKKRITASCLNSYSEKTKKKTYKIEIDEHAFDLLMRYKFEEIQDPSIPPVESTFSEVIEMMWDDYCDANGEPDRELG